MTPRTNKQPPGQTIGPTNKGYIPVVLHILSPKCENPYKKLGIARPKQMCLTDRKLMDRTIQNPKSP